MALPKPPYCTFSRVHVPEEQKGHAVRATVHDKASVVLAGCKTPNDLFSLLFPSFALPFLLSVLFRRSCLLPSVYSTSLPHPLSASTSKLHTARCSETLQLLAGGLASYAVLALCVLCGNRRQFAPICVWHHFLEIFAVALKPLASSRSSTRSSARRGFASGLLPKLTTNSSNLFWNVSYIHLALS